MKKIINIFLLLSIVFVCSCRTEDSIIKSTSTQVSDGQDGQIKGFFLLNEGNMGSNKATLDYYDYTEGMYHKNIFAERNPNVAFELGDVGNDIKIWGSRLYAVINCSNLVEVMDVSTAQHIGVVSIPNCRYITFEREYAYVSSYSGEVSLENPNARLGYIAKIDTASLEIVSTCDVGYQPEQMVIVNNKLYVANSGGYMFPDYDNRVSVIDLESFTLIDQIEVAINLHQMKLDSYGQIWVSSRGDYYDVPSMTYVIDPATDEVTDEFALLPNSSMTIVGDSLYIIGNEYDKTSSSSTISYALVNTSTKRTLSRNFIDEQTQSNISNPYSIAVNPYNKEIFITDNVGSTIPGKVYCFDADGIYKWDATTGDIPAHIVFTNKALEDID